MIYIYGSEVVGLMCLRVFTNGDHTHMKNSFHMQESWDLHFKD